MNKYITVFKTSFKQESKTMVNSLVSVVSFFVIIFIFRELWSYIYGTSGYGETINGYSWNMMIWYLIMAEILTYAIHAKSITRSFSYDIKTGKIAYQLNKPYNYFGYQISNLSGVFSWKLCFLIPAGVVVGLILLGPIPNFSIAYILPIFISLILAILLTCIVYGIVGLFTFWIQEATPFAWIVQKFVMMFGLFFPPEFFPDWMQPYIIYSPIYALMSGPSKLLANFSWELFMQVSVSQIVYIAIFLAIGLLIFQSGTKKVYINGG